MSPKRDELIKRTKAQLYESAKKLKIVGRSRMTKAMLIESILSVGKQSAKRAAPSPKPEPAEALPTSTGTTSWVEPTPEPEEPRAAVPYEGDRGPDLPTGYGMTLLRVMPRDPHWVFLYWEVSEIDMNKVKQEHGPWVFDRSVCVLRAVAAGGVEERRYPVLLDAGSWYLPVESDAGYVFEIGLVLAEGAYVTLARSNDIRTASAQPSDRVDESWMIVEERFQELLSLTGGFDLPASVPGSEKMSKTHQGVLRDVTHLPWSRFEGMSTGLTRR